MLLHNILCFLGVSTNTPTQYCLESIAPGIHKTPQNNNNVMNTHPGLFMIYVLQYFLSSSHPSLCKFFFFVFFIVERYCGAFGDLNDLLTAVAHTCTDKLIIIRPHLSTRHSAGRKVSNVKGGGVWFNGILRVSSPNKVKLTSGHQGHYDTLLCSGCHLPFLKETEGKQKP